MTRLPLQIDGECSTILPWRLHAWDLGFDPRVLCLGQLGLDLLEHLWGCFLYRVRGFQLVPLS